MAIPSRNSKIFTRNLRCLLTCLSVSLSPLGCGNDGPEQVTPGNDGGANRGDVVGGPGTGGITGGSTDGGGTGGGAIDGAKIPVGMAACSDGIDNDKDGLIDYNDPECVGPLDNDEGSFATGIPGDNVDACKQDCFFDGNSGMGDDGCQWQLQCDPLNTGATAEKKCEYDPDYVQKHEKECSVSSSQSDQCIKNCRPLTPNGCDCFVCCLIPGAATAVRLSATCTAATFDDPTKCQPCTQVKDCDNPCEHCELCLGKTVLPADCTPTPDGGTDGGSTDATPPPPTPDCGAYKACARNAQGQIEAATACPADFGCVQGCCFPTVIP